jgi:hypothetical protein
MCPTSQPKFWPKKPVTNVSGNGGQDGEPFHGGVLAVADLGLLDRQHGHVRLQDRAQQVPLRGDHT